MQEQQRPRSFEPSSRLACAEGRLRHVALCEAPEEPFERPLPDLVIDNCGTLFLQDCVAVNPQDVVGTANSQTFLKEGEFCLWVLAELDAFVHCSDDIRLARELVRDELPRPNSDVMLPCIGTLRTGGMSSNDRTPRNEGVAICGMRNPPVHAE